METTEVANEGLCRRYRIDLDESEIQELLEKRINELQPTFSMQGFRSGKVPKRLILNKFGDPLRAEVTKKRLDDAYKELLEGFEDDLAVQPRTELRVDESNDRVNGLDVFLEVKPEMPDLDFSAIRVERPVHAGATGFGRDETIKAMSEALGDFRPRDNEDLAQFGDLVEYDEFVIADGKRDEACTRNGRMVGLNLKGTDEDEFVKLFVGRKVSEKIEMANDLPGLPEPARELGADSDSRELVIESVLEPVPADEEAILSEMDCDSMDEAVEKWESFSEELFGQQAEAVWRANLSRVLQRALQFEVPPTVHALQSYSQFGIRIYPESYMWPDSEMRQRGTQSGEETDEDATDSPDADSETDAVRETEATSSGEPTENSALDEDFVRETRAEIQSMRAKFLGQSVGPARLSMYFNHLAAKNEISVTDEELAREVQTRASMGTLPRAENEDQMRAVVARVRTELTFRRVEDFLTQLVDVSRREYTLKELFPQYLSLLPNRYRNQFKAASDADVPESTDQGVLEEQPSEEGEAERAMD